MDITPAVLIFTPIFLPIVTALGMDPVHFGIVIVLNLCVGICTPPVGTVLFVGCSVGRGAHYAGNPAAHAALHCHDRVAYDRYVRAGAQLVASRVFGL